MIPWSSTRYSASGLLTFVAFLALAGSTGSCRARANGATAEENESGGIVGTGQVAARLAELGIELGEPSRPVANYVRAVSTGNLVFLAGHIPRDAEGEIIRGKLGVELTVEDGYEAAKRSAIGLLESLRQEIGNLDRVTRVVKVFGMVNSAPDFTEQSAVVNGCSDLLVEVFGERAKHARAAVGMASLPLGAAVEIEMIVEVTGH